MIDSQYAPLSEKIKAAIAEISDKVVRFVLNTHWHGDHSGGNENMAKSGAIIVAHENVRKRMSKEQFIKAFSKAVPASPEAALPVITFSDDFTTYANGEAILLFHVHNAHTDGDAIVYLPKSNVIHMGDTFFNGIFPFIDMSSGGSIDGVIETANRVLFLCDEETKIIPGHGPLGNKKDLMAYRDMLMTARDRVKQAIKAGMTYEEIKAANLATDLDDDWKSESRDGNGFVDLIYTDLSREK
jgi:glyoxylase-like metal-dependent hydrolase (beta-lactamase superfamily II)